MFMINVNQINSLRICFEINGFPLSHLLLLFLAGLRRSLALNMMSKQYMVKTVVFFFFEVMTARGCRVRGDGWE